MATVNPYYYGLVKQIGPWKTTRQDILRGQKPYQYTPNESTENPYTMKSGNGQLYETYSSQGLIYDAATSPVVTVKGKLRRGRVVRSKKVVQIIDSSGNIVAPTDNYFLNRYMGEMRADNREQILQSDLGTGMSDAAMMSARVSTATMASASTSSNSAISTDVMDAIPDEGPTFEGLNIAGEENVDRGAQLNNSIVNDQIDYIQNLERERIYVQANVARDRWLDPQSDMLLNMLDDQEYLNMRDTPPNYENIDVEMVPTTPGYQQRRRRSSLSSNNPAPTQRRR